MSILIVSLKLGFSLERDQLQFTTHRMHTYHSLVFFELLPIELLMLAWDVHPQASLATYRARAVDLESYTVGWEGGWAEIDVGRVARQIGRAVVFEGQQIDGVVVHLLWRHAGVG